MAGSDWRISMIAEAEQMLVSIPVPDLPEHFSTKGWYVRPDIIEKQLTRSDSIFQMRIAFDDGSRRMHKTISVGSVQMIPERAKGAIYATVSKAVAEIRQTLFIVP